MVSDSCHVQWTYFPSMPGSGLGRERQGRKSVRPSKTYCTRPAVTHYMSKRTRARNSGPRLSKGWPGIEVFSSKNDDIKAGPVERFQWTLQNIMHRHFTSSRSRSFLKVLPEMVRTYNTTYHRAIGMAPAQVRPKNYEAIWQRLYGTGGPRQSPKLKVGDHVRISETRRTFKKGYLPHWSLEIFHIDRVLPKSLPTYTVVDFGGEVLQGSFYEQELQVVQPRPITM